MGPWPIITGLGGWPRTVGHDPRPLKFESTRGKINASLLILRVASERRDAQNERDGADLRSSVAAAAPSQLRRTVAAALQPSTQREGGPLWRGSRGCLAGVVVARA